MKWCNRNTRRIDSILDKALEWNSESYTVWLWFTKLGITIHASAINPDIGASLFGVNKGCRRQFENTCGSPKQKVVLYKQYQQVTKQFLPARRAVLRLPTAALDDQPVIPEMATHESSFMKWCCKSNISDWVKHCYYSMLTITYIMLHPPLSLYACQYILSIRQYIHCIFHCTLCTCYFCFVYIMSVYPMHVSVYLFHTSVYSSHIFFVYA